MIYVNKVENLAGGPTRGMPRRWFRTSAGLNNPDPGPRHPHTPPLPATPTPANGSSPLLTVLGLRYFIRLLSLDRCSAGIMILRNLLRLEKGQILCRSSGRVVYVESLRDLGGYSKRNRNYGWLLLREGKDRSFFIFFFYNSQILFQVYYLSLNKVDLKPGLNFRIEKRNDRIIVINKKKL